MNLKELSSPIRMYWDIGQSAGIGDADCRRIAGEIAANKVLTLQLTETGPSLSHACLTVLDTLKDKMVALSLVLPLSSWNEHTLAQVLPFHVRLLLISTIRFKELGSILKIKNEVGAKPAFGIAFCVNRDNFQDLLDVVTFCIEHRIQTLVLPMQRLTRPEDVFSFSRKERQELASKLSRIERPGSLKIIIHDPFLWRAFFPNVEFPDGGCQAANTMLFIAPDAGVYPCPTLPVRIGNLQQMSLKDVITSDLKKEVRKNILSMPAGCNGCEEVKQCKGGCRGRAYAMTNSLTRPDPACR